MISTVTVTELRLGVNKGYSDEDARQTALEDLDRLLARFEIVDVTRAVGTAAADLIDSLRRRGEPVHDLQDVYIGATARTEQLPVLTAKTEHFERMDDVSVIDWTTF